MEEIVPGLFHWRSFHERIRQEVSSYYYEPSRALIDPTAMSIKIDPCAIMGG